MMSLLQKSIAALHRSSPYRVLGRVERVRGLVIESQGPRATLGELCRIRSGSQSHLAEVVGFNGNSTLLMALEDLDGLAPGAEVVGMKKPLSIGLSPALRGRVINGLGDPLDGKPPVVPEEFRSLQAAAPHPLLRRRITRPLAVGVRSIDGLLTLGEGQRVGIFAGSGVGKSVLLGMMAKYTEADVVVIGLIGERGREVREFIEKYLGEDGLRKAVVVVETSERWPLLRIKGVMAATTIAEYFRDQGLRVLMLMDSITRVCFALREVGLSLGEPPATRGYPPSVFATVPKLLERTGTSEKGSITALYSVLVEGDDHNEPVADTVRSVLDGHIVLSRKLAARSHYPAVDVLTSISRVMPDICTSQQMQAASTIREWLAAYEEAEDLIAVGAYSKGSRPVVDQALERLPQITAFLKQGMNDAAPLSETLPMVLSLAQRG